jgi:hypothetical protein
MGEFFIKSNKFKRLNFTAGPNYSNPKDFKIYIKPQSKPVPQRDKWGNDSSLYESDAYLKIGNEFIVMKIGELTKMISYIESVAGNYVRESNNDLRSSRTDILNMVFNVDPNQEPF